MGNMRVAVIIPTLNEAGCVGRLVRETRKQPVDRIVVVDNGSTDDTANVAREAGAQVVLEPRRGYGYACAAGVAEAADADVLVFLDGDHSFLPSEMPALLAPLRQGHAELVLGSRSLGRILPGAMPFHQRFGNWLAALLVRTLYGVPLTDIGPYRAVRGDLLRALDMREMAFGWPVEMVVKAARRGSHIIEVPVSYHPREAGRSKVSGTVRGTVRAAYGMIGVTLRYVRH